MRAVVGLALLFSLAFAPGAYAQFSHTDPNSIDLTLQGGASTTLDVSWTFDPLCVRPFEVNVVASDPAGLLTNLSGVQQNLCGGDTTTFQVRFTGAQASQSYDLLFVDDEFGGTLESIPVTVTLAEPPEVESAGERSEVLSCFYDCKVGPRPDTWDEVTTLTLVNPGVSTLSGGVTFFDGQGTAVATSRIVLGPQDTDEVNVCRTLMFGGMMPPKTGLVQVLLNRGGGYGWVKNHVGKFFMATAQPSDGRVEGIGKTECRVVPPSVGTRSGIATEISQDDPIFLDLHFIEDTGDERP